MLKNYFLASFRRLLRDKVYAGINIGGLALGISCCLLIALWIGREVTYDRFHPQANRLYQIQERIVRTDGFDRLRAGSGMPLGPLAATDISTIESTTRLFRMEGVLQAGKMLAREPMLYADSNFFDLFGFTLAQGNPVTALQGPSGIVVSKKLALKYFGSVNVVGRTMVLMIPGRTSTLTITGLLAEPSGSSHIKPECITSLSRLIAQYPPLAQHWDAPAWTYALVREGADAAQVESQLNSNVRHWRPEPGTTVTYHLAPIQNLHLLSSTGGQLEDGTDLRTIYMYAIAALIILTLACANFISLTIARSSGRMREIGVRKAVGGRRSDLVMQFVIECIATSAVAVLVALALLEVLAPAFARFTGEAFAVDYFSPLLWLASLGAILLSGALAGLYPAIYLSSFRPVSCFSGKQRAGWIFRYRNILILSQFGLSAVLLMCTAVGHDQVTMLTTADMGFTKDNTLIVPTGEGMTRVREVMSAEIAKLNGVAQVSAASNLLGGPDCHGLTYNVAGDAGRRMLPTIWVDKGFVSLAGLHDIKGNPLTGTAEMTGQMYLTASAAQEIGLAGQSPVNIQARADGDRIWYDSPTPTLLQDFYYRNLYFAHPSLALVVDPDRCKYLYVRVRPNMGQQVQAATADVWSRAVPNEPFESFFLDDYLRSNYGRDLRYTWAFASVSMLALIVACVGLIGLSAYLIAERTKEIGIRKVMGASATSLVWLFSRRFLAVVVLATLLAAPVAWWLANKWLQGFPLRVPISPLSLALAAIAVLMVALAGVAAQAAVAASANPIDALRYE